MATAKELLLEYMELIRTPEKAISLFSVEAAIEIPYLVEVGLPGRFEGHNQILKFLRQINELFPDVFFGRLMAEGGRIKLLREAINIISAAQTILPNGLSDVAVQRSASL